MYNEFDPKHYKGKWPCTTKTLYNEKTLIGRLHQYFLIYFETFSVPTADTLFLLILSILTLESTHSIRFLYQHFLSGITEKITECILLCMFLCNGWLFLIYEYYCQDCFEADTGFIADATCISVCGWYDGI